MFDKIKGSLGFGQFEDEYDEGDEFFTEAKSSSSKKSSGISSDPTMSVVIVKPSNFEDSNVVADNLKAQQTVVLNLESTPKEISRRIVDFLSGVAYANDGQIKRVANSTFIITPSVIRVDSSAIESATI